MDSVHTVADFKLFTIAGTPVTVATLASIVLILIATVVFSRAARASLERMLGRRGLEHEGRLASISRLLHYLIMLIGGGVALQTAGIDLGALFAAGAIFAIGIGFAMQTIAQNFVSGVILLMEQAIKPGDIIEVEGALVRVERLGIRSTVARTRDEEQLIIPNATIVQSTVKNFTLEDTWYRLRVQVGVAYGSDVERTISLLQRLGLALPWRDPKRPPQVQLVDFADSSVVFELAVFIDDPWQARIYASELRVVLWRELAAAGITIAFPQLDVHFDPPAGPARLEA